MEKCPNCGSKLSNLDVLCPRCGALVEVVQLKKNMSTGGQDARKNAAEPGAAPKNEFRPNLIVYNEDLPIEDIEGFGQPTDAADAGLANPQPDADAPAGPNAVFPGTFGAEDSLFAGYKASREKTSPSVPEADAGKAAGISAGETPEAAVGALVYEDPYAESYLAMVKNMRTAEQADVDDFDPEAFMHEYRQKKNRQSDAEQKKQWLEIEEAGGATDAAEIAGEVQPAVPIDAAEPDRQPVAAEEAADADLPPAVAGTDAADEPVEQTRRYRQANYAADADASVAKKARRLHPLVAAVLWVVATAVIFCGFYFLNGYVAKAYGGYDHLIYTITSGKINTDTDAAYQSSIHISASEIQTEDGAYAHVFDVNTVDGVSATLLPTGQQFTLDNGYARITVPDSDLANALGVATDETSYAAGDIVFQITTDRSVYTYPVSGIVLHFSE